MERTGFGGDTAEIVTAIEDRPPTVTEVATEIIDIDIDDIESSSGFYYPFADTDHQRADRSRPGSKAPPTSSECIWGPPSETDSQETDVE